jgi:hypothetical protein
VAAGNESVTIGTGGALVAQLVPNIGASPTGTFYVVVFQLDDGTVRTEYWAVPTTSPTTIAAVRTTPGPGRGNMAVTQHYVNAAVANRAIDSAVVHLAGAETISGAKQFAVAPSLPPPGGTNWWRAVEARLTKILAYFFAPVFQGLFHYGHELISHGAVDDAVIITQCEVDDGTDRDGIVSVLVGQDEWLLGDSSYAQDGDVGLVNDGQAKHGAELAGVRDGEGCAFNIGWHQFLGTGALAEIGDAALQS